MVSAIEPQGIWIAISFLLSAMSGTRLHLAGFNLPQAELLVALSTVLFGILLVIKNAPDTSKISLLAALAGLCYSYAYGKSILGAQNIALAAYLIGFTTIQALVSIGVLEIARTFLMGGSPRKLLASARSTSLVVCGIGAVFLHSQLPNLVIG